MSETAQAKAPHASPQHRELPSGWRWVRLAEVTSVVNGTTPDSENPCFWNGDIVWITPTDLGKLAEPYIRNSDRKITKVGFDSRNLTQVPPRSVVLSSRAPIGHLGIAAIELCTNQGCKSFIPNDDIHEWFLYYALKRSVWKLQQLGSGATFAEISKTQLENFIIPIPPIEEQRRIAGVLREQMEALEKARTAAQVRLEAVKALPAAFLRQVFPQPGQPLPNGWRWVKLGEVCEKQTGIRDPRTEPETVFQYVDITSVSNQRKCITEARTVLGIDAPSRARQVIRANDIIVATTRPNLNAVAQVPSELDNQICSTGFCVLRTGVGILPDYIFAFVRYESFIEALTDLVKGALYPAVTDGQVKAQQIPLPPLSEQRRIAGLLREQMTAVEKARAAAEAELNTITALPAALLLRAFAGEL